LSKGLLDRVIAWLELKGVTRRQFGHDSSVRIALSLKADTARLQPREQLDKTPRRRIASLAARYGKSVTMRPCRNEYPVRACSQATH
jgi:hypothetical protein